MNILGVRLNVLIGPDPVAVPAPVPVLEALQEVEVTESDRERSGFRLTFAIGRSSPLDLIGYGLVESKLLEPHARVVLTVFFDVTPRVIMDGIVTRRDMVPGDKPGQGRLILSGHDVSIALDRETKKAEHPAQDETLIVMKLALSYAQYGMVPKVMPPPAIDPPIPIDRTPQQHCTDWAYLNRMASRFGYVTYVDAGPAPLMNVLYWGPPVTVSLPQPALNVNLGSRTNVTGISFADDGLAPARVESSVLDRTTGQKLPVMSTIPTRPPLGAVPIAATRRGGTRVKSIDTTGLSAVQALTRAQAEADAASDDSIRVSGTLDCLKYNDVLRARRTVDLRGAGLSFNGSYLVRNVTHHITRGNYTQDFTLSRAELAPKFPAVRPA